MDQSRLLLVSDLDGFTPQVARLICMMEYARHSTVAEVQGLTGEQLDHLQDAESNSIGALLHHIASIEWVYQVMTFDRRRLTPEEETEWTPALELGEPGRRNLRGRPLGFYLDLLAGIRARTLEEFKQRDDAWLAHEEPWGDRPANYHFMWFHVMEDELNHRGQIRWLKRRLPQAVAPA